MKKIYELPLGTQLMFDEKSRRLTLAALCGMTCGHNGIDDGYSNSGLFLASVDNRRLEGKKLEYRVCEYRENLFSFEAFDAGKTLSISAVWEFDAGCGIVSCRYVLKNTSDKAMVIRRALPRWAFSPGKYCVYSQQNRWGAENQLCCAAVENCDFFFHGKGTRTSVISAPYCVLEDRENGASAAFHVIPRGSWGIYVRADMYSNEAPAPVVEAGLGDQDLFISLASQAELELPEILVQKMPREGLASSGADLQQYMIKKRLPDDLHVPPVLYNSWLYRFTNFTREELQEQLAAAKELGCEVFIVDAGWFGKDDSWFSAVGDWDEKPGKPFYGNMASFAGEVRSAGLRFGFWMEIERFGEGASARKEHPEWFPEHSGRIDLTQPAAAEYLFNTIAANIRKFGAEYIKIDCNAALGYDDSGAEFYYYTIAFENLLRRLRREFPLLVIENCGSGALRNDLATACLYDHAFVSDNAHPFETLSIRQGAFMRTLPGRCLNWIVTRPAPERRTPVTGALQVMACAAASWDEAELFCLDYVMLSGLLGVPGFSGDLAGHGTEVRQKMAEYVAFYKENRKFFVDSRVYLLTPFCPLKEYENFVVFQMQGHDSDESLVFVFSNGMSRRAVRRFKLFGLKEEQNYLVEKLFAEEEKSILSGSRLMTDGLAVRLLENQHVRHTAGLYRIAVQKN